VFTLTVRDHVMVAHSLPDPFFGPAQRLHGATYVVEAAFERAELDEHGVVLDIGAAGAALADVLGRLAYRNLDEVEELAGRLTTTEFLARWVAERLAEALEAQGSGRDLAAITVVLREHPDAWASYRLRLRW
jgi:6-pyruvoyltetrahydropterin/6-carboxytetrahydropterin synthase